MVIYPAIDMYEGKAVRLYKGDYNQMTVYHDNPVEVAQDFLRQGASRIHIVDLEGAKDGTTPNFDKVCAIKKETGLFCEIGGGIRTMETIDRYLSAGIDRVILGTAAVQNAEFAKNAVAKYGEKIAIGIDIKDGYVAIKGWTEKSQYDAMEFCGMMQDLGIRTLICTDISRDGAMKGANHALYQTLQEKFSMDVIASGGVSSMEDVERLANAGVHGAIIGKAYYTGAICLADAIEVAK